MILFDYIIDYLKTIILNKYINNVGKKMEFDYCNVHFEKSEASSDLRNYAEKLIKKLDLNFRLQ